MSCLINILDDSGLHAAPYTAESLAEAAAHEPADGVYTVANTFETFKVLRLNAHLDRLEDSAARVGIPLRLNRTRLCQALRAMIAASGFGDVRFRITVPAETPDRLILSIEPFRPYPAALYEVGVAVSLAHDTVRHSPEAKTTAWIHDRAAIEAALPEGAYTAVLVGNDGQLLEGVSSNFYAIVDGALRTAGADVLGGIAQQIVLLIAPDLIPVRREAITLGDLPRVQEAFITSASRGIMPVVRVIDPTHGITFGDGRPGERTRALRERYLAWASAHAETL